MARLLIVLLLIAALAFFALQNQSNTNFAFAGASFAAPLFLIVTAATIVGVLVGLMMVAPMYFSSRSKKIDPMEQVHAAIDRLNQKIVNLEDENARLREARRDNSPHEHVNEENGAEEREKRPTLFERLTH